MDPHTRRRKRQDKGRLHRINPSARGSLLLLLASFPCVSTFSTTSKATYVDSRLFVQARDSKIGTLTQKDSPSFDPSSSIHHQFASEYQIYQAETLFSKEAIDQIKAARQPTNKYTPSTEESRRVTEKIRRLLEDETDLDYGAQDIADRKTVYSKLPEIDRTKARDAVALEDSNDLELDLEPVRLKEKRKKRITANVVETGSESITAYMKSLSNHQVLTSSDESVLGRQIQLLERWEKKRQALEKSLARPPTFGEWADALETTVLELRKQVRRSHKAKAALMEANLRLVISVARQTVKKNRSEINFQDACQEGILGLSRACDKFDPERGFRFSTYAVWWIKSMVHRNLAEQSRPVRLPQSAMKRINEIRIQERVLKNALGRFPTPEEIGEKIGISPEQVEFYRRSADSVESLDKKIQFGNSKSSDGREPELGSTIRDPEQSPSQTLNKQMMREDVRRLIKTLSPREQAVIRMRFGLDNGTPRTFKEIGKKFNVNQAHIRKIEARALGKLRQPYRRQRLESYISDI